MRRSLSFLFIILIFLSGCSSTKSLTSCAKFKGHPSNKHLTKSFSKKKNKRNKNNKNQVEKIAEKIAAKEHKQTKRINKISQKVIKQLEKRNVEAALAEMPQNRINKLSEVFSSLEMKPTVAKEQSILACTSNQQQIKAIEPIGQHKNIDKLAELGLHNYPKHPNTESIYKKQAQETNLTLPKPHGFAIASLIGGILSILISFIPPFSLVPAVLAIIFGAIGIRRISEDPKTWRGKGMAIAGIIMGSLLIVLTLAAVLLILAFVL